jgi:transcriptional regulator with GAF, ATPase, and Fis domain
MSAAEFSLPFESIRGLLLDLARERSLDPLLDGIVHGLARHPEVALARIWLIRAGDICCDCPLRQDCPGDVPCLHLVKSAGTSREQTGEDWSGIGGSFRRFPIGQRKVGHVAATAEAVCVQDTRVDSRWIVRPEWARREGILGFGGQPLVYHGEVLGVLGVFVRASVGQAAMDCLRMLADHAAAAIANARAFEENTRLRQQLEVENEYLREEVSESRAFGEILGASPAIRRITEQIELVAPTDASVLILGESGTGKELVAREIHRRSRRQGRPMIRVNCASVPEELYESEFFGHVRGSFTGAVKDRIGRFAAADGGTLFLDEVGEIPVSLQSKLLRVLQEGHYERVGDDRTRSVDVRIVAATNRDLAEEVRAGRFREDLYYRLNVFPVEVPPLRARPEDIALLAERFLDVANRKLERRARLQDADLETLRRYAWPGNVRELQNVIERAVITARDSRVRLDLPGADRAAAANRNEEAADAPSVILTDEGIRELEKRNLLAALARTGGRIYGEGGAAELLGLKPTTLASRIARLGLKQLIES